MPSNAIPLPPNAATFPDGSTDQFGAGYSIRQGSQTGAKSHIPTINFDGAGTNTEYVYFVTDAPVNLSTNTLTATLYVVGMLNATTNTVFLQVAVSAVTPGDADTPLEHAFAASSGMLIGANATEARRLVSGTVNPNMDGWAPGDALQVRIFRSPADASDTATPDFEYVHGEIQYTPQA